MSIADYDRSDFNVPKEFFAECAKFEEFYQSASPFERATLWMNYQSVLIKARHFGIEGVSKKLKDIGSKEKLIPTLSEIRVAVAFCDLGHLAKLMPDSDESISDITVSRGSFTADIEVTQWAPDDSHSYLGELLHPTMEKHDLIMRFSFPNGLSEFVVDYVDRDQRKKVIENFASSVIEMAENLDPEILPTRKTLPLVIDAVDKTDLEVSSIIQEVKIQIERSEPGRG